MLDMSSLKWAVVEPVKHHDAQLPPPPRKVIGIFEDKRLAEYFVVTRPIEKLEVLPIAKWDVVITPAISAH